MSSRPVEVISMGAFSGVLISPRIKPALAKRVAINKTSVRMADAERTAQRLPAKLKPLHAKDEYCRQAIARTGLNAKVIARSVLINQSIDGFLHPT